MCTIRFDIHIIKLQEAVTYVTCRNVCDWDQLIHLLSPCLIVRSLKKVLIKGFKGEGEIVYQE